MTNFRMTNDEWPIAYSSFVIRHSIISLLFLFRMQRVLAKARAVLFQLQLFAAHLPPQRVVVIAGFLAHEKDGFALFLALCHARPL